MSYDKIIKVVIGETTLLMTAYQAAHCADTLHKQASAWEKGAVDDKLTGMWRGDLGDFKLARDGEELALAHMTLAVAFYHAADMGNSHFLCDPDECEKQRERLARLGESSEGISDED